MSNSMQKALKLYSAKRYELALEELLSLEVGNEEYTQLSYYLGLTYTRLERWDEAVLYLEQVVSADDNLLILYQSRMLLGFIYTQLGRYRLAEYELRHVLQDGYESAQAFASLAFVLYSQKNIEESVELLRKAVSIERSNANALNSLGYILAEENISALEGVQLCRKAVGAKPNNPAYLDSLGWAYYRSGNLTEARTYLRRALDLSPGNREIAAHMKAVLAGGAE